MNGTGALVQAAESLANPAARFNPLLTLSIILVAGVTFGMLARRLHLPSVTGQILAGILIGGSVLGLLGDETLDTMAPVIDFALGLMAVAVGSHLNIARLGHAKKRLAWLLLFEALLTPGLIYVLLIFMPRTNPYLVLLLAAIAVSTAPATILALVKETRSKGIFVKTLVAGVALNNLVCICLFEFARTTARAALDPAVTPTLTEIAVIPFEHLIFAAALGGTAGLLLILLTRKSVRSDRLAAASIITILLTVGLAEYFHVSTMLSCLFLGITLANITPDREEIGHKVFDNFEYAIFAVFFTVAGMELHFDYVLPAGLLALLFFLGRFGGKYLSAWLAMRLAGATDRLRRWLGVALVPQAGLAVGLMLLITDDPVFRYNLRAEGIRDTFLATVLTAVLLNEIVGPILTRLALRNSGDYHQARARLIDFLHEENIVVDLEASTKEEAFAQLVDVLIATNRLTVDRSVLLDSVVKREAEASTCLGHGLAIPHGVLPDDAPGMVGAMGLSRRGLGIKTPDDKPVHCMVLLGTPSHSRDRHLEVLAALARSIGSDPVIRQQLYTADTPAHAYEMLHAEEAAEDFNYFLED